MNKIVFLCGLLLIVILAGCGARTESALYYYSPSWTNEGKIIYIGATETTERDLMGSRLGYSYFEYVKHMFLSGTGESSTLFDATGAPPYNMSCSPTRAYVAYLDDLRSGEFGKIQIKNISLEAYTGMKEMELNFSSRINSFDWSSDGNNIVYCTSSEVRIRSWNDFVGTTDTLVTSESDIEFVSWKYGSRIAFVHTVASNKILSLIYSDGSGRTDLSAEASVEKPQISSSNTNEVYGLVGTTYVKVNVNTGITAEVASSCTGSLPRLSPAADTVVYSKPGESSGIYALDVATGVETKVK